MAIQYLSGEAEISLENLSLAPVDSLKEWIGNFDNYPAVDSTGVLVEIIHRINDTLSAPAFLYVPKVYDYRKPSPLMISLHGGVSGPEFRSMTGYDWSDDDRFQLADRVNGLLLFPMGKIGCLWWDETGMANIKWLVREVKRKYNIDDDRVTMYGFSDGASGSFHFGMLDPTDYAFFTPWSGHIAVGTLAGPMQSYIPNLSNRPVYATTGGRDQLYPTARMEPLLKLAYDAGVSLWFTSYDTAAHNGGYLKFEMPLFERRIIERTREPFPMKLYWEADNLKFGRVDWLEITKLDTGYSRADWHIDYNYRLVDDRVSIGFMHDREWDGEGVRIASVVDNPNAPAVKAGMQDGDLLIMLDDMQISDIESLEQAKGTKKRGDKVTFVVVRGSDSLTLSSEFPQVVEYDAFRRDKKSGALRVTRFGNKFLCETSRIGSFSIYLNSEMIRFDQPVLVVVNGKEVYSGLVRRDSRLLLDEFKKDFDRRRLWEAKIDIGVEN